MCIENEMKIFFSQTKKSLSLSIHAHVNIQLTEQQQQQKKKKNPHHYAGPHDSFNCGDGVLDMTVAVMIIVK